MKSYDEDGLCVSVCEPKNPDIEEYMEKLLIRGRKEITVNRYRCVLLAFCRNLRELGKSDDPRLIQEDDVYEALTSMAVSLSSQESYAFIIRQCRYWKNYDPNGVRILTNHEAPTAKWISYDELVRSMSAASTKAEVLMLYLGGNYSLRRGEISKIKVTDIKRGYMVIHGKGHGPEGKVRHVPLVEDEDPVISEYLEYRKNLVNFCDVDETEDRLLVFRKKKTARSYTPEHVGKRCKEIMNSVGVDGTTHSLRREFITTAYRADAQLRETIQLQKLYISSSIITYRRGREGAWTSPIKGEGKGHFQYRKCLKPKPFKAPLRRGEKMPKLVTLPDVLYQVYVFGDMNRTEKERPMSYKSFKKIMLASEMVVTEKTIRQKYDQIVAANFAKESRGRNDVIILNVPAIINELIYKHKIDAEIIPITSENCGSHTQTHTQTEVSS